jgi:hypothetical protein
VKAAQVSGKTLGGPKHPMAVQNKLENELDNLAREGEQIIDLASSAESELRGAELSRVMEWSSRAGYLIKKIYGPDGHHAEVIDTALGAKGFTFIHSNHYAHLTQVQGTLKAALHEVRSGLLVDIRRLLEAEIFVDFLEMAEYLLSEKYKDAAAVIVGAVLEDTLRKLATAHGISDHDPKGRPLTMEPLNVALAKAGLYNALQQKQITSWAALRNAAAHGKYGEYDAEQVNQMLHFVQNFAAEHLR